MGRALAGRGRLRRTAKLGLGWAFLSGELSSAKERRTVRFIIVILLLFLAAMAGLYVYGQMLDPEQRMIEEEARDVAS